MRRSDRVILLSGLLIGCGDSSGPDNTPGPGQFVVEVRGPVSIDASGQAQLIPGLPQGTLQSLNLLAQTSAYFYHLEVTFSPPTPPTAGNFTVGPTAAVRAAFYMFNRQTQNYDQIAIAQSGTLTLDSCDLMSCRGKLNANARLEESGATVILNSAFHAR
jgi:hypothetical protein